MSRVLDEVRWTLAVVLVADVVVVAAACLIVLLLGSFERATVGWLTLGGAAFVLLMALGSSGGLPIGAGWGGSGMAFSNTLHAELQLQQSLRDGAVRKDLNRRRVSGVGMALIGLSLLVIGFAVVG